MNMFYQEKNNTMEALFATISEKAQFSKPFFRMNFFIKHLAAADLCVGLISVLTDIIWKITISWEAGLVACKLIRFLQVDQLLYLKQKESGLY